jgi:hypothetical protein
MNPKEIQQIEQSIIILAKAIEDGRIEGLVKEVMKIMGYVTK